MPPSRFPFLHIGYSKVLHWSCMAYSFFFSFKKSTFYSTHLALPMLYNLLMTIKSRRSDPSPDRAGRRTLNKSETQQKYLPYLLLAFAVSLGAFIRLYAAWKAGFPMVDGGMFLSMARDIQSSRYLLPMVASYNNLQIPFAYPPLGFYLLAGINTLTGISLLSLLQWLPAIFSALTIPAFYLLAGRILGSNSRAALATVIFALSPQAFEWQLMGGGLTRSLGALFAILTLYFAIRMFMEKSNRLLVATLLTAAVTVYSHPEWALQTAAACVLAGWFFGRNRPGLVRSLVVALGVLILTMPWWLTVGLRHGLNVFLLAAQTPQGRWLFWWPLLNMSFAGATNILVVGLGLVGVFICLKKREHFLPVWLAASFLVDLRSAAHVATLQLALLATLTLVDMVFPWFKHSPADPARPVSASSGALPSRLAQIFMAYLFVTMLIGSFNSSINLSALNTLGVPDRQAMDWVRENTPVDSRFVVLGWIDSPWVSPLTEWFPALSGRYSLTTVQGREWLSGEQNITPWIENFESAQSCLYQTTACLEAWAGDHSQPYEYVYLSLHAAGDAAGTDRLSALYLSLATSQTYQLVYNQPAVRIFHRIP